MSERKVDVGMKDNKKGVHSLVTLKTDAGI
jgi:hypothetical protein